MPENDLQLQIQQLRADLDALNDEYYRNNFLQSQDFQKYVRINVRLKLPTYATAPTVCEVGEVYVNSGNGKHYTCTSANTWTVTGTQS